MKIEDLKDKVFLAFVVSAILLFAVKVFGLSFNLGLNYP
jgi:uncharacterized membrane protein